MNNNIQKIKIEKLKKGDVLQIDATPDDFYSVSVETRNRNIFCLTEDIYVIGEKISQSYYDFISHFRLVPDKDKIPEIKKPVFYGLIKESIEKGTVPEKYYTFVLLPKGTYPISFSDEIVIKAMNPFGFYIVKKDDILEILKIVQKDFQLRRGIDEARSLIYAKLFSPGKIIKRVSNAILKNVATIWNSRNPDKLQNAEFCRIELRKWRQDNSISIFCKNTDITGDGPTVGIGGASVGISQEWFDALGGESMSDFQVIHGSWCADVIALIPEKVHKNEPFTPGKGALSNLFTGFYKGFTFTDFVFGETLSFTFYNIKGVRLDEIIYNVHQLNDRGLCEEKERLWGEYVDTYFSEKSDETRKKLVAKLMKGLDINE